MQRFDPRIRLPWFLTRFFPEAFWRIEENSNQVYFTFDDGPVPEATPWILDLLKKKNIKACFFCVGENVKRYPHIYTRILEEGHQVGNHTFNHLQGLKTSNKKFFRNIIKASKYMNTDLFRPPHGWMRKSQYEQIKHHYQVVMWDILSGDYKKELTPEDVIQNVMKLVRPGSIITFHDSKKSIKNLQKALPVIIEEIKKQGYEFDSIPLEKEKLKIAI